MTPDPTASARAGRRASTGAMAVRPAPAPGPVPERAGPGRPLKPAARGLLGGLLSGLLLLAGCAQPPKPPAPTNERVPLQAYQAPAENQPHARIVVRAALPQGHSFLLVHLRDDAQCREAELIQRGTAGQAAPAMRLPVGELVTLDFAILFPNTNRGCGSRWSFRPQAGRTYVVQGGMVGAQCSARIADATEPERVITPPDLVARAAGGSACLPLAQSVRVQPSLLEGGQDARGEAVLVPRATDDILKGLMR